ncbi:hypothetical protein F5Y15DRAFT_421718 [Xylariaceae sp. FL0016]|nr:hypothetical protein F5Y15DRAFT_421718 [Xylariaceae sp. FL0016]
MPTNGPQRIKWGNVEVISHNMNKVLAYFGKDGLLHHPSTQFNIVCRLCQKHKLAIVNINSGGFSRHQQELYQVLPRCGHAFGHKCLFEYLERVGRRDSKCPTCRTAIYCEDNHRDSFEVYGQLNFQAEEIMEIGRVLDNYKCPQCPKKKPSPPRISCPSTSRSGRPHSSGQPITSPGQQPKVQSAGQQQKAMRPTQSAAPSGQATTSAAKQSEVSTKVVNSPGDHKRVVFLHPYAVRPLEARQQTQAAQPSRNTRPLRTFGPHGSIRDLEGRLVTPVSSATPAIVEDQYGNIVQYRARPNH